ncbi:MAG: sigma 54-interacting transcriptional regulator [Candidatus Latescibacteria bacterium]|jgi:DNA-binding NtrC family response regulator/ligand-binding sensor domain-containing protein|nr:sigma 54-interacting transcriptional regulator [Candidatus Latescibacterota bacterium]
MPLTSSLNGPQGMSEHFGIRDGLPDMKIESLHCTDAGNLWIGTHSRGLAAFDGDDFQIYTEREGVSGRSVFSLCEDHDGVLWVGTDGGVTSYTDGVFASHSTGGRGCLWGSAVGGDNHVWFGLDRQPGQSAAVAHWTGSEMLVHDLSETSSVGGASIASVVSLGGDVWLAGDGLYVARRGVFQQVMPDRVEFQHIKVIAPHSDGILIGSAHGTYLYEKNELRRIEALGASVEAAVTHEDVGTVVSTRSGEIFLLDDGVATQICDLSVPLWRSLAVDGRARLWIGSYGFGLYRHDRERLKLHSTESGLSGAPIHAVDATRTLSVATSDGLVLRDSDGHFGVADAWVAQAHGSPDVTSVLRDRQGLLWIGKRNGYIYTHDGDSCVPCAADERMVGYAVDCMEEDSAGRIWVASSVGSGFAVYDDPDSLTYFSPSGSLFAPPRVSAIATGPAGEVYLGSAQPNVWDGIAELDGESFRRASGLSGVAVNALCVGPGGRLWVGSNEGLAVLEEDYILSFGMSDGLSSELITSLSCDKEGRIWIGTEGGGLCLHDGDVFQVITVPGNPFCNTVSSIAEGSSSTWIATNGGLLERQLVKGLVRVEILGITADRDYSASEDIQIPDSASRLTINLRGVSDVDASRDLVYRHRLIGYDRDWIQIGVSHVEYPGLRPGDYRLEVQAIDRDLNYSEVAELTFVVVADPRLNAYREALSAEGAQGEFVGDSDRMAEVIRQIQEVAWTDLTVLVLGETGTGKGIAAKRIHECSERRGGPFVYVNCGSLQEGLVDSELFGHEKGAFTGAFSKKLGKFELAHAGTIFLDEIGDLPLDSQARLLKVLQDKTIERVGGTQTINVDVRVVAATNRNLAEAIQEKRYRADLFYRLNVFPIEIPPLRDRREDTPALAMHFVAAFASHLSRPVPQISSEAMESMLHYEWPGNVRELEHTLQRAVILSGGGLISMEILGIETRLDISNNRDPEGFLPLEEDERQYLQRVLEHTGGVIHGPRGAAAILQVKPTTLRSRLERLGVQFKKKQMPPGGNSTN